MAFLSVGRSWLGQTNFNIVFVGRLDQLHTIKTLLLLVLFLFDTVLILGELTDSSSIFGYFAKFQFVTLMHSIPFSASDTAFIQFCEKNKNFKQVS